MSLPERRVLSSVGEVLRTPDSCFDVVVGYDWPVHDVVIGDGLHLSYVDAGPRDAAETMLLLHGEPMWGYLYHKMVGPLVAAGFRVIVPDLIGFGRSDKPTDELAYSYSNHVAWIREMVEILDLTNVTFFGQDWGGLIGSRMVSEIPDRFARLVFSNTGLPRSGPGVPFINAQERLDPKFVLDNLGMDWRAAVNPDDSINSELVHAIVEAGPSFYFLAWRLYAQEVADVVPSKIIPGWCLSDVSPESLAAYDAPFPTQEFAAGARRFPMLVPITLDDPERLKGDTAWKVYSTFTKPVLTLWGDRCPFTYVEMGQQFREGIPGAQLPGVEHKVFRASHFIQEDLGPEMAAEMVSFVKQFSLPQ